MCILPPITYLNSVFGNGNKDIKAMAFTNFGKRFFIYIQAVLQCHSCLSHLSLFFFLNL